MKTLIIHPDDRSTDFLKPIYEKIEDKTVITKGLSKSVVHELIDVHDRIIMMGHGCPYGLFSMGLFPDSRGLIIDQYSVVHLQNKDCIFIWCNADRFVEHYGLKGFYSGMFISEIGEAYSCNIPRQPNIGDLVNESNDGFAKILGDYINNPVSVIHEEVTRLYQTLADCNPVASYNNERLYLS